MTMGRRRCHHHQILVSPLVGGAGLVALQLARHVRDRGHADGVWIPGPGPARDEAERLGLSVQEYDSGAVYSRSRLRSGLANWRIGRRLRAFGPGIAHVHSPFYYRALRVGLQLARVKTVAHVQLEEDEAGLRWAFQAPPDRIVTCARFLVDHVRRNLPARHQERQAIVAVPNAVDTDRFRPGDKAEAKARVGAPADAPLILMLANLSPHKGQETAIRATALLKGRGLNVCCWLAGTEREAGGSYTVRLLGLIRAAGVEDRVQLLGHRPDAPDLLRAADIFLLPSTCEGLPLSLLEAQATKVPVLAAATAGVPEVVCDEVTGFLIPQADAEGYARRIEALLGNRGLYGRIAESAYEQATREYNWKSYLSRITELYEELQDSDAPRAGRVRQLTGSC